MGWIEPSLKRKRTKKLMKFPYFPRFPKNTYNCLNLCNSAQCLCKACIRSYFSSYKRKADNMGNMVRSPKMQTVSRISLGSWYSQTLSFSTQWVSIYLRFLLNSLKEKKTIKRYPTHNKSNYKYLIIISLIFACKSAIWFGKIFGRSSPWSVYNIASIQ